MAWNPNAIPRGIDISNPNQFGKIILKLNEVRQARGLSMNQLSLLLGVSYTTVTKYCRLREPGLVDFNFLAKCCYVLCCHIHDLVDYIPAEEDDQKAKLERLGRLPHPVL